MTDLFEKSIQILELPKVLERLAGQAVTQEGKERCLALRPMTDPDDVQRALDETSAAVDMSALRGSPSFSGVKPVAASLQRAHMGGALNTRELLDIAAVLRAARSAREYGEGDERKKTCIDHLFRSLTANRFLEDKITGSIVGEDEIADAASPELASIRRHIRATASKVWTSSTSSSPPTRQNISRRPSSPSATTASWCPSSRSTRTTCPAWCTTCPPPGPPSS